eukprot:8760849-Prorocentrum_lima.AAC.1
MTSSLVGSEMCIRDRTKTRTMTHTRTTERGPQGQRQIRPPGQRQLRAISVSYTHLTLPTICSV